MKSIIKKTLSIISSAVILLASIATVGATGNTSNGISSDTREAEIVSYGVTPTDSTEETTEEPTEVSPQTANNLKLTVKGVSNYFPEAVASYNADTKEVVVTYYLKASKNMMDCQYSFFYDPNILTWSSKNNPMTICPTVGTNGAYFNPVCGPTNKGLMEGRYNASSLYLYDFSSGEKIFAQFRFDVKEGLEGNIETVVELQMQVLRVSLADPATYMTNEAEEVQLVNSSKVMDDEKTASVTSERRTNLTESTYIEKETESPTEEPTVKPTESPTEEPTEKPTEAPTEEPTVKPTETPTEEPTDAHSEDVTSSTDPTVDVKGDSTTDTPSNGIIQTGVQNTLVPISILAIVAAGAVITFSLKKRKYE